MSTISTQPVLDSQERYKTLWHRTYAPLRRAIAGTWEKRDETKRFIFRIDADGGFELRCFDTDTFLKGRYTIVAHGGGYYIGLDSKDGQKNALKIDEVDMWRLTLSWMDDPEHAFELVRSEPILAKSA